MSSLPKGTVYNFKKSDNGFYTLGNGKVIGSGTIQCSHDAEIQRANLMKDCQPGDKCDIVELKDEQGKDDRCAYLLITKDNIEGEYYRTNVSRMGSGLIYNDKDGSDYDKSKPSYRFIKKENLDKRLGMIEEKNRLKFLFLQETLSLEEMSALGEKYGDDKEKMFEDTKIPSDWCLSIDPCPKGLECCSNNNNNNNSSSQSFFDKNKKLLIIGLVALIIFGGIIYVFKRKNVDVKPVSRKRRSRK